jgi:hypothetical protein
MRSYAKIPARFWSSPTGQLVRSQGQPALVVALYLLSSPHSSMLGFYYLPLPTLAHETAFSSIEGASKALQSLSEVGFATYDEAFEEVWIPTMPAMQIGESLAPKDLLVRGLKKELQEVRSSPFFNQFLDIYAERYHLGDVPRSEGASKGLRRPSELLSLSLNPSLSLSLNQKQNQKLETTPTATACNSSFESKPLQSPFEAPSGRDDARPAPKNRTGRNGHKAPPASTAAVWAAYCGSYRARYGEPPVRNAPVNGMLAQLLSADEAPEVVKFYVQSQNQYYVTQGHSVAALLRDCEKLRTEWKTGRRITVTGARSADQRGERGEIGQHLLDKAAKERGGVNA